LTRQKPTPAPTPAAPAQVASASTLRSRHALRIPEAAEYIGATNWFIEELVRNGEIPFRDYGKYRTLDADDLDAWIQEQPKKRMKGNAIQVAA
jgi:excisionase family DNA binding protein